MRHPLQVFSALCAKLFVPLCRLAALEDSTTTSSSMSSSSSSSLQLVQACSSAARQLLLSVAYHPAHVQGLAEACSKEAAKVGGWGGWCSAGEC